MMNEFDGVVCRVRQEMGIHGVHFGDGCFLPTTTRVRDYDKFFLFYSSFSLSSTNVYYSPHKMHIAEIVDRIKQPLKKLCTCCGACCIGIHVST